jgi:hypothetical protein
VTGGLDASSRHVTVSITAAFDARDRVIVPALLRDHAPRQTWRRRIDRPDGRRVVELDGREICSAVHELEGMPANLRAPGRS